MTSSVFKGVVLTLSALGILAYSNAVRNPFVHDDVVFIRQNPAIADLKNLAAVFVQSPVPPEALSAAGDLNIANPYYRPVLEILYRLQYRAFGFEPAGYHVVNMAFHVANGILIFLIFSCLTGRPRFSWGIAALFLLHPVQSESVACVAGISNLVFSFCVLAGFYCYLRARRGRALAFFVIGLFAKEQAIILPFLAVWYECLLRRHQSQGRTVRLAGFALATAGYFLWRKLILGGFLPPLIPNWGELLLRIAAVPRMILTDLRLLILPYDLHYYRSVDILAPALWGWAGLLVLCFFCYRVVRFLPKEQALLFLFGAGWFLIGIFPTVNLVVPLVYEYSLLAAFEHFLYLPLAGFLLCAFTAGDHVIRRYFLKNSRRIKTIVFSVAALACMLTTLSQNRFWAGEIPLFERVVAYEPRLGRARLLLGKAYYERGAHDQAVGELTKTVHIMREYEKKAAAAVRPFYQGFLKESLALLAQCAEAQGDLAQAITHDQALLELFPRDAAVWNNMGIIFVRLEDWDEALRHFTEAVKIDPENETARQNLERLKQQRATPPLF